MKGQGMTLAPARQTGALAHPYSEGSRAPVRQTGALAHPHSEETFRRQYARLAHWRSYYSCSYKERSPFSYIAPYQSTQIRTCSSRNSNTNTQFILHPVLVTRTS